MFHRVLEIRMNDTNKTKQQLCVSGLQSKIKFRLIVMAKAFAKFLQNQSFYIHLLQTSGNYLSLIRITIERTNQTGYIRTQQLNRINHYPTMTFYSFENVSLFFRVFEFVFFLLCHLIELTERIVHKIEAN